MTITTDPKHDRSGRGELRARSAGSEPGAGQGLGYSLPDLRDFAGVGFALPMTVPAVVSLTSVTSTAPYGGWAYLVTTGQTITFTLATNEAVRVAAGTTLTLSNGATAVYTGNGAASASNTFVYTVASGDASARDLLVTGYSGSISDQGGQTLGAAGVTEDTTVEVYFGTTTFSVSNQDQMSAVFHSIDIQGPLDRANTGYSVTLNSDFALAQWPPDAINVEGSDTLMFDGGGHTISGGPYELFLIESGAVTFEDLNITGAQSIVMRGGQSVTLEARAGHSMTVSGPIANEYGSNAGLIIQGAGAVVLSGANSFVGGVTLRSGILTLGNASAAGSGEITFAGAAATLGIRLGDGPANLIGGLAAGDGIDLKGIGLVSGSTLAAAATLTVHGSTATETLHLDPSQDFGNFDFVIASDGHDGTLLTVQAIVPAPVVKSLTSATSDAPYGAGYFVTAGQSVTFTLTTSEAVTVAAGTSLTLSNGATALYSGDGSASASNTFTYVIGAGDDVARDLQVTGYTGSIAAQDGQILSASGVTEDTGVTVYAGTTAFSVSDRDQFATVFHTIDLEGALSAPETAYSITLTGGAPITGGAFDSINLDASDSLLIDGGGLTTNFTSQGIAIAGGAVTFKNLNMAGPIAITIAGGPRASLEATAGQTMTISGAIADLYGPGLGVEIVGPGTVVLSAANSFAGGVGIQSGVLELANASASGSGEITFDGPSATLAIEAGDAPANALNNLAAGDKIDLKGIGLAAGSALAAAATLTVHGSTSTETLHLDAGQDFGSFDFAISS
ncbi:MAG TPA: autotransporter-associated beta strand repeat-containing protein, partial [Caulobacteraceae bacterium]|nr:autotransporter-associated beta strand repeat-containing protein [Caulobacteraceae bacterium]